MDKVKLVVTQEKFDKNFSIDDWFNFDKLSQKEVYDKQRKSFLSQLKQKEYRPASAIAGY